MPVLTLPELSDLSHWYAVYVCVRHEKRVAEQLAPKGIEHYLPVYEKKYRWRQRQWMAELPLFPGYVFVRIPLREKLRVLEIPSVVHLVGFAGKPAMLREDEIEAMRSALASRKAEPYPYLTAGKRVCIQAGPLSGLEGVVVRRKKQWRIVVSVDCIHQSMAVELDAADLQLIKPRQISQLIATAA